jgi:hypothetical protein
MSTTPLDERVVDALTKPATHQEVAAVRDAAEHDLAGMLAEADAADAASLSPLATRAQATELRTKANDLRFEADRLEASVSALNARILDLREAERANGAAERLAVVTKERDELAAEIARDFPQIVGKLTHFAKRIAEVDAQCMPEGLASAETIGRGIPANFYEGGSPVMRIGEMVVPLPDKGGRYAWGSGGALGVQLVYPGLAYLKGGQA